MNKILLTSAIALVSVAVSASPAFAAPGNTATATGTATAVIVAPITLNHPTTAALGFGRFTTGLGGSVIVSSAGVGSVTGEVTLVPGSTNSADSFTVAGDASRSFSIATTGGNVTSGATNMPFTTTPSAATLSLSTAGAATFTVGGTLTVSGTAPAGSYTGSYTATVTYN